MRNADVDFFQLADQRLAYLARRQTVLAQNLANASTPGWRSHDLKPFNEWLNSGALAPVSTNPMHLAGLIDTARSTLLQSERAPDGNAVALDEQLVKVADTDSQHALVIELYKKYAGLFRIALGR